MKRVLWDKSALETIRSFSVEVRQEIGALLRILQDGGQLGMPQSKPMKQLAPSAFELRIIKIVMEFIGCSMFCSTKTEFLFPMCLQKRLKKHLCRKLKLLKRN